MKFARIKPRRLNPKAHKIKTYTVFGIKFQEERGWYEVDDDVAEYLKTIKQTAEGPDSQYSANGFDVVDTLEAAQAMDEREKEKAARALAEHANRTQRPQSTRAVRRPSTALTTDDLNEPIEARPARKPVPDSDWDNPKDEFPDDPNVDIGGRAKAPTKLIDGADEDEAEAPPAAGTAPETPKAKADHKGGHKSSHKGKSNS